MQFLYVASGCIFLRRSPDAGNLVEDGLFIEPQGQWQRPVFSEREATKKWSNRQLPTGRNQDTKQVKMIAKGSWSRATDLGNMLGPVFLFLIFSHQKFDEKQHTNNQLG